MFWRWIVALCILGGVCGCKEKMILGLPETHPYQRTLKQFIRDLDQRDFEILDTEFNPPQPYEDNDSILRDYIGLQSAALQDAKPTSLIVSPFLFTLEAIESKEGVRCLNDSEAAAWWISLGYSGNPFRYQIGARYRCAVMAIVNMVMLDDAYEQKTMPRSSDYRADALAGNLLQWLYAYPVIKTILPQRTNEAFLEGLEKQLSRMLSIAPRDINTNIDMMEILALALASQIWEETLYQERFANEARRILFGSDTLNAEYSDHKKGTFNKAGYIAEMDGPETSYNGVSLYYLMHAAAVVRGNPNWDTFFPEVLERMLTFKAYQTYVDPDGYTTGPSSWSKRTNASYAHDQRARFSREMMAAMLYDQGLYLLQNTSFAGLSEDATLLSKSRLLTLMEDSIVAINRMIGQELELNRQLFPLFKEVAVQWPDDLNYAYDRYVPGAYERFELLRHEASNFLPPYAREASFNKVFSNEFWAYKSKGWGFQVETVPDMGRGYDRGGSGALAGGSLTVLWSKKTGCVLLGKLPGKWDFVKWDSVSAWTTNHIWGELANGRHFSSARNRTIEVEYDDMKSPTQAIVDGVFAVEPNGIESMIQIKPNVGSYHRSFSISENRLLSKSFAHLPADASNQVWESFPLFIKDGTHQLDQAESTIELELEEGWAQVPLDLGSARECELPKDGVYKGVRSIRIQRFTGECLLQFKRPKIISVEYPIFKGAYQTENHIMVIHAQLDRTEDGYLSEYEVVFPTK